MPNYIYNVGATDSRTRTSGVTWHREPQAFPGAAQAFAETVLRNLIAADPRMAGEFITIKVWDNDRAGPGDFSHVAAYALNNPEEPRRPDEISVDFFQYYVASADYEVADDAILGGDGTEWSLGTRAGLIVPSDGPAMLIRTGHQFGYITVDATRHESEPAPDLAGWEAAEHGDNPPAGTGPRLHQRVGRRGTVPRPGRRPGSRRPHDQGQRTGPGREPQRTRQEPGAAEGTAPHRGLARHRARTALGPPTRPDQPVLGTSREHHPAVTPPAQEHATARPPGSRQVQASPAWEPPHPAGAAAGQLGGATAGTRLASSMPTRAGVLAGEYASGPPKTRHR